MKKKIGIIGGMGTLASVSFFERLAKKYPHENDQDYFDMCLVNEASMPDRTEIIVNNKPKDKIIEKLENIKDTFEVYGVENIGIICNTFHYFYDDLKKLTDINIFHMPKLALDRSVKDFSDDIDVLVMCTDGSKKAKVYEDVNEYENVRIHYPNRKDQELIMKAIYEVKQNGDVDKKIIRDITRENLKKYDAIIYACTELSVMKRDNDKRIVDAMDALIDEIIRVSK
ncbi:MAG: amino acid racemase [Tissierellia bacterium]|nr:amino acid racemase [Tissierellia bacterium]